MWIYDADGVKVRAFNLVGQDHSSLGSDVAITGAFVFSGVVAFHLISLIFEHSCNRRHPLV